MGEGAAQISGRYFQFRGIMTVQARAAKEAHLLDILADGPAGFGLGFDKETKFRASGYGLEA